VTATAAYEAGLEGADCWVRLGDGPRRRLPLHRWLADADHHDARIVAAAVAGLPLSPLSLSPLPLSEPPSGPTPGASAATGSGLAGRRSTGARTTGSVLDVGCGPGRLTAAVAATGALCVGIDVSATAVGLTRARGARAVRADVFGAVPRAGRWDRVLLADGNLGIGGDPAALLARAAALVRPGGRVVADVEPAGGVLRATAWVEATRTGVGGTERVGGSLPWAWVGRDAVTGLGRACGLRVRSVGHGPGPCIVVWEKRS
jgi:SAM-dependent methyltransferase